MLSTFFTTPQQRKNQTTTRQQKNLPAVPPEELLIELCRRTEPLAVVVLSTKQQQAVADATTATTEEVATTEIIILTPPASSTKDTTTTKTTTTTTTEQDGITKVEKEEQSDTGISNQSPNKKDNTGIDQVTVNNETSSRSSDPTIRLQLLEEIYNGFVAILKSDPTLLYKTYDPDTGYTIFQLLLTNPILFHPNSIYATSYSIALIQLLVSISIQLDDHERYVQQRKQQQLVLQNEIKSSTVSFQSISKIATSVRQQVNSTFTTKKIIFPPNPFTIRSNNNNEGNESKLQQIPKTTTANIPPKIVTQLSEKYGYQALHIVCQNAGTVAVDIFHTIVQYNPSAVCAADSKKGNLPIHTVCTTCTQDIVPLEYIIILVQCWPDSCQTRNLDGNLPLHLAVQIMMIASCQSGDDDNDDNNETNNKSNNDSIFRYDINNDNGPTNGSRIIGFSQHIREASSGTVETIDGMDTVFEGDDEEEAEADHDTDDNSNHDDNKTTTLETKENLNNNNNYHNRSTNDVPQDSNNDQQQQQSQLQAQLEIVQYLCQYWPDGVHIPNKYGYTPLQVASVTFDNTITTTTTLSSSSIRTKDDHPIYKYLKSFVEDHPCTLLNEPSIPQTTPVIWRAPSQDNEPLIPPTIIEDDENENDSSTTGSRSSTNDNNKEIDNEQDEILSTKNIENTVNEQDEVVDYNKSSTTENNKKESDQTTTPDTNNENTINYQDEVLDHNNNVSINENSGNENDETTSTSTNEKIDKDEEEGELDNI